MEYRITHACGHEQAHYLSGFASQMDRKAAWLQTTKCKSCFVAEKRSEQADAVASDSATIAHLDLPALSGSDRQVSWASTIRAKRLAAVLSAAQSEDPTAYHACSAITDAKWWIDHREVSDADLLIKAQSVTAVSRDETAIMAMARSG